MFEIEREADGDRWWIVSDNRSLVYGTGPTLWAACWDYLTARWEFYWLDRRDRKARG